MGFAMVCEPKFFLSNAISGGVDFCLRRGVLHFGANKTRAFGFAFDNDFRRGLFADVSARFGDLQNGADNGRLSWHHMRCDGNWNFAADKLVVRHPAVALVWIFIFDFPIAATSAGI